MKLTPFGFVNRAESFFKEAFTQPPRGGGAWVTRRMANFMEHTGTLHVLVDTGPVGERTGAVLHSRITGGPRDAGIQGWVDYPAGETRQAFVLRETDADRAMEEIFDIVENVLARIPEWDNSVTMERPKPPPRVLEPLIPEIQIPAPGPVAAEPEASAAPDAQAPTAAVEEKPAAADAPSDMQSFVDSLLSPENFDSAQTPPAADEPEAAAPGAEETPAEETPKAAKKAGRGRKAAKG